MTRDEAIAALRAQESQLRKRGLTHVALFGSTARNEAGPGSDIDLLIDYDHSSEFSLFDLMDVVDHLKQVLGQPVEVALERKLRPRMRARVLRDAIPVF